MQTMQTSNPPPLRYFSDILLLGLLVWREGFDHYLIGVGSVTENGFFDPSSQCTCRTKWKNFYKDKQLYSVIARSHEEYKVIDTFFSFFSINIPISDVWIVYH